MTTYATLIVFNGGSYLSYTTNGAMQRFIFSLLFLGTFLLPVLFSTILWKNGNITSLEMPKRDERHAPFALTLVCYFAVLYLLWKLPVPRLIAFITLGGILAILWSFLINLRWKISIHMTGIGGLFGLIYGLSYSMNMPMIYLLMIIAVIAGVLGMSRMLLKAHTPAQVYVGFLSGFFIEVGYCYLTTR